MPELVDLRSDTVTRPTAGMRRAMAAAEVGDDLLGEDPSVRELEELAATRFAREAALFVPSGVMANQLWLRVLARPGTEVTVEADAHVVDYEDGAGALLAGVQFRTLPTDDGLLDATQVEAAIRPDAYHLTPTSMVAVEQTHNRRGGTVYPLQRLRAIAEVTRRRAVNLYMDGARLFNAAAASDVEPSAYAALVQGLMFSLSKGLGAPVGSVLVGDAAAIGEARRWRRRYGGAMRQSGIIAAGGTYALRHHVDRLHEDHANARRIATVVADACPAAVELGQVQTNLVYVRTGRLDALQLQDALAAEGVLVAAFDQRTLRLVTHLDVDEAGCRRAGEALARHLAA